MSVPYRGDWRTDVQKLMDDMQQALDEREVVVSLKALRSIFDGVEQIRLAHREGPVTVIQAQTEQSYQKFLRRYTKPLPLYD